MARATEKGAASIAAAFDAYLDRFHAITRDARRHFEKRDWAAAQRDSARRLDLYTEAVDEALAALEGILGPALADRPTWTEMRGAFERRVEARGDREVAETFFNSISRRIFHTIGVDPEVEFVSSVSDLPEGGPPPSLSIVFAGDVSLEALVRRVLDHFRFETPWEEPARDAARIAEAVSRQLSGRRVLALEIARAPFFRSRRAFLVGRARLARESVPFVLALANPSGKIVVDAALTSEDEVSIVFSFARSYFFVDAAWPREMVSFLSAIMPRKPIAELYNAIGWNKHGKTELYRSLLAHLRDTDEPFERAPGQRGMVMCVFTLPRFDVVFKVMRDRFEAPKSVTHGEVRAKYRLVFRHDRAGRLVDAQEFEHLEFDAARFEPSLLRELTTSSAGTVSVREGRVVIRHLYTERRLKPLDVYLAEAPPDAAREAVLDYGQVLKDLAGTNIFPGDMLLKNFGVSRHGRLIFYDYDELSLLSDCVFRKIPEPRGDEEEFSGEPWFHVGERDVFPEEFRTFLGLRGELLRAFLERHEELFDVAFWRGMQARHAKGETVDVLPYKDSRRLG